MAEFTNNNTLTAIGNYRIINFENPFLNVITVDGFTEDIQGLNPPLVDVYREFRWSCDDMGYSIWMPLTEENLKAIQLEQPNKDEDCCSPTEFYIQLKYTLISLPDTSVTPEIPAHPDGTIVTPMVIINSLDIIYTPLSDPAAERLKPVHLTCSDEYATTSLITGLTKPQNPNVPGLGADDYAYNPYNAVNKGTQLYKEISQDVTKKFGHEVCYYRVEPQKRSKDVVLKEYTIHNVRETNDLKVMVPDNEFPDNKFNFNSFGVDFEVPFEIHVDVETWKKTFGEGTYPRKRDILHFKILNRFYEIQGAYNFSDFMQQGLYYKIYLVKYQPRTNTIMEPEIQEQIEDYTISTEELFGEERQEDMEKITKPQQYTTITDRDDPIREFVNEDLCIVDYQFMNNWTLISENYYEHASLWNPELLSPNQAVSVRYKTKANFGAEDSRSFLSWINSDLMANASYTTLVISTATEVSSPAGTLEIETTGDHRYVAGDYVFITTNGSERNHEGFFEVLDVISPTKFRIMDKDPENTIFSVAGWKVKKTIPNNLLAGLYTGMGMKIDLFHDKVGSIYRSEIVLSINDKVIRSFAPLEAKMVEDEWYGVVINISNKYKQIGFYLWEMVSDINDPQPQTTELNLIHKDVQAFEPEVFSLSNKWSILASPINQTNIRLFDQMMDESAQPLVLNQNVVRDAQRAIIIDNAKVPLRLPKIARNR